MCSRGVFQLKKLMLYFCDYGGSSAGVRQLISSNQLKDFLTVNPQIKLQVICKRNHHPHVRGIYVNGYTKSVPLRGFKQQQAIQAITNLRNQLGRRAFSVSGKRIFGSLESIQGKWQPNLFNKYPVGELSKTYKIPDIPEQKIQIQDPKKDVRKPDLTNQTLKVRQFIDIHDQNN